MSNNFNKILGECIKNINFIKNVPNPKYKSDDEYNLTLDKELGNFKIPISERKKINTIIYNAKNADGNFSAAIAYNYITSKNKNADISLYRLGEGENNINRIMKKLEGKIIIIFDLEYKDHIYKRLGQICKTVYTIDDHKPPNKVPNNVHIVSSNHGHSAVGLVWKTFYPKIKVPPAIKIVDTQDSKKYLKGLPYGNYFVSAITFRYTSNPTINSTKWSSGQPLKELWDIIKGGNEKVWAVIGKYMNESIENLKEQIARNAQKRKFQGYTVGILNYDDPVLYKRISRQINDNMPDIDFAVLWGWQYSGNRYKIFMGDNHYSGKVNLGNLARKLGKIADKKSGLKGGIGGGGGHLNIGNFYWPRNDKTDIWDLLENDYITNANKKNLSK